jgi:hypothetical protein
VVPSVASPLGGGAGVRLAGPFAAVRKDYERLPETAEAMIYGAMSRLMLRRLVQAA